MIDLIIEEKGYTIDFEGKKFRTPAVLTLDETKVNNLIAVLRRDGIKHYRLEPHEEKLIKQKSETDILIKKEKNNQEQINNLDTVVLLRKMDMMETLLKKIIEKEPTIIQQVISSESKSEFKKEKDSLDDSKTFIPDVDLGGLEIKSSTKKTTRNTNDNAVDAAEALANLNKKEN